MTTDRRALIRAYKEARRPIGVFAVRHLATGRALLGTSVDVPSMLNRQRTQLRLGMHANRALQSDWNALGPDAFAFEILDTLPVPNDQPDYRPDEDLKVLLALWRERQSGESY